MKTNKRTIVEVVIDDGDAAALFNFVFLSDAAQRSNPSQMGDDFRARLQMIINRAVSMAVEELQREEQP